MKTKIERSGNAITIIRGNRLYEVLCGESYPARVGRTERPSTPLKVCDYNADFEKFWVLRSELKGARPCTIEIHSLLGNYEIPFIENGRTPKKTGARGSDSISSWRAAGHGKLHSVSKKFSPEEFELVCRCADRTGETPHSICVKAMVLGLTALGASVQ